MATHIELHTLKTITNDFSDEQKVGSGGYGDVYKAVYNGEEIAVKLLHLDQGTDDQQFMKELSNHLKVQHPNIVQLVGYCNEESKRYVKQKDGASVFGKHIYKVLCFEYMQGGSLYNRLSENSLGDDWHTHYQIIKGTCKGLCYLHRECGHPILHLDLKPANILLDKRMNPKIADFGLATIFTASRTHALVDSVVGTSKYMPPELIYRGEMSVMADIYGLGVTLMDVIMGSDNFGHYHDVWDTKFVEDVLTYWMKRDRTAHLDQVKTCTKIAIRCMDPEKKNRPTIEEIMANLNGTEKQILSKFCRDDPGQSIIPSKSSITSRPSSGHAEASRSTHMNNYLSAAEPMAMTFQELHHITDGFSEKRLLGKGGFGMVYKGVFDNGEVIAVKKLHNKPGLVEEQFKNELLNLVTVKHPNIIRLVGYCSEAKQIVDDHEGKKGLFYREERALCLEYLQGGNLEELLSDESCELDWEERYRIIKGICQGLKHLHTGSKDPIYHLDLKPANILLDSNRIPKIGDFGLSRLLASKETFVTKTYSGTTGYMPPEYMHGRQISSKFDVFSLGVIIIEIIAGPEGYYNYRCLMSPQEFINHVSENWSKRVQAKTISTEELLEVQRCINIALRCVEDKQAKRPSITEIVEELNMIS